VVSIHTFLTQFLHDPRHRLLLGNGLAQAMLFGGMAGISRLYAAEPIGTWSACIAFISLVWSFSQLKTDVALIQARDGAEKRQLLDFGLMSHLLFSGIAMALAHQFGLFSGGHNLLLFIVLASHGIQHMFTAWCLSASAYTQVNWMRLTNVLLAYPGSLLLFYFDGERGLLWALLAGNLIPALVLLLTGKIPLPGGSNPDQYGRVVLKKHLHTMSYLSLGNFLMSLTEQGMVLLISIYYDAGQTAAFFLASRVCNQPLSFVQMAMGQYNLRHFQDLLNEGRFSSQVVWKYWKTWLPAGLAFSLPILLFGPFLFSFVFGEAWAVSGDIARILAVLALLRLLNSPTSMGFFVIGKQRIFFLFTLLFSINFGLSILFAWLQYPLLQMIGINSVCQVLLIVWYNRVMLQQIDRRAAGKVPTASAPSSQTRV